MFHIDTRCHYTANAEDTIIFKLQLRKSLMVVQHNEYMKYVKFYTINACFVFISAENALHRRLVSRVWRRFPGGASVNNQEQRVGWAGETSSLSLPVWSGCQDLFRWFLSTIEEKYQQQSRG